MPVYPASFIEVSSQRMPSFKSMTFDSLPLQGTNVTVRESFSFHSCPSFNFASLFTLFTNAICEPAWRLIDIDNCQPMPQSVIRSILPTEQNLNAPYHRAKEILARKIIADFVLRCNERRKERKRDARKVIADFMSRCNERRKKRKSDARKVIGDYLWFNIASRRRLKLVMSAMMVQKIHRGHLARKIHSSMVQQRLEDFRRFTSIWSGAIRHAPQPVKTMSGWALVREKIDLKRVELLDDDGDFAETDQKLVDALTGALRDDGDSNFPEEDVSEAGDNDDVVGDHDGTITHEEVPSSDIDWSKFRVSTHVVKFIKNGDPMYRNIFVMRMKQLARGDRSHKLQKPLIGCRAIIYESYMDNSKGGFRILWTQERDSIVVWFIAKHKVCEYTISFSIPLLSILYFKTLLLPDSILPVECVETREVDR